VSGLVRIATRKSPLALWQARHIAQRLQEKDPSLEVTLLELSTEGDRFLQAPLSQVGGKGLFVKEIEAALLDGRADLAVHSLKDMTSTLPEGVVLAVMPEREDPRDAFVSPRGLRLEQVPAGEIVGTSSLRRSCQLLERRPDLRVESVRGNVQTRLRKTKELGWAGTMLALAGLRRLGLEAEVTQVLSAEESLPAVGQGVLGIECRADDARIRALLEPLDHAATRQTVAAERAFLARLEGGCTVPLAGYAVLEGGQVWMRGLIGSPDGRTVLRGERRGPVGESASLGVSLAEELLGKGGKALLELHGHAKGLSGLEQT
jgi:hydroxymethylbilane synthase